MTAGDVSLFEKAVATIRQNLAKHPEVELEQDEDWLWVRNSAADGFDVGLSDEGGEIIVHADSYHEHHADAEQAAAAFCWLLTPAYRIVVETRGNSVVKSTLEIHQGGRYKPKGVVRAVFPCFGRKEIRILQNRIVDRTS